MKDIQASILVGAINSHGEKVKEDFIASIINSLKQYPGVAEKLLKAYNITSSTPKDAAVKAILNFFTDIGFAAPTHTFAKGWPGTAYVYYFNEKNPWDGPFKGKASHILDVAFIFQNYSEHLSGAQAESAKTFAADVIKFVNGRAPWAKYDEASPVARVYGPSESAISVSNVSVKDTSVTQRRGNIFQFEAEPGLDVICNAFGMFLAGQ